MIFNLADGTSTAVNVLVSSDVSAAVSAPMPVAALSGNRALVLLTPLSQNEVREIDLKQMTVRVRTDLQNATPFSTPPSTMASSADGSVALLGGDIGATPEIYYAWKYDTDSDAFSAPTTVNSAEGDQVAVNGNGTVLGMGAFTLGQDLSPLVPGPATSLFSGTGGLRYSAGTQVQISDTRNGRSLLSLPLLPIMAKAFAIDPTGQKILVVAGTSLNYYQLAVVPLAVGTVSPATATPGTTLTIRGDGFTSGTMVSIAGTRASCTMTDGQTLQCVTPNVNAGLAPMTLSNPDGQTYSFEAAVHIE